jgi:hemolysin activation/secretion protein
MRKRSRSFANDQRFFPGKSFGLATLAACCFVGGMVHAQTLPGSVDPSRAQERLRETQQAPRSSDVTLPEADQQAPQLPPEPTEGFVLKGISVEGNTLKLTTAPRPPWVRRL